MIPKTKEQKRVATLIGLSHPLGKRAVRRIEEGRISKQNKKTAWFSQWEAVEEYQVFRYFEVRRDRRSRKVKEVNEMFRNYLNTETKKITTVSKTYNGMASMNAMRPVFNRNSELEIRIPGKKYLGNGYYSQEGYSDYCSDDTYVKEIHPGFRRSKVNKKLTERFGTNRFLDKVYNSKNKVKIETAMTWKDEELVEELIRPRGTNEQTEERWRCILIARRHGADLRKIGYRDFFDYLDQLKRLGKDIRNPKYICPENFTAEHNRLTETIARMERERKEKLLKKLEEEERLWREKAEETYKQMKKKYLKILIKEAGLTIRPLQSVKEFREEGEAMHHCVYANNYYKREYSLILTARASNGKRIETVEYDLVRDRVIQSRGKCNTMTKSHNEIVRLISERMPKILRQLDKKAV